MDLLDTSYGLSENHPEKQSEVETRPGIFPVSYEPLYRPILDRQGKTKVHKNIQTDPEQFFDLIFPYLDDIVVGVECVFCPESSSGSSTGNGCRIFVHEHKIPFILGHALYMKAIHGGKTKNDKIDSFKIAALLRGGNFPKAYAYPSKMRATRDLLRRRMYLSHICSELVAHIQNTNTQYNLPVFGKKISRSYNRDGVTDRFEDPIVRKSVEVDFSAIDFLIQTLRELERYIEKTAHTHDYQTLYLLRTIPGIGQILALVILCEINDIRRFPRVQDFSSYAHLVRPKKESDGKWAGYSNKKIGNHHLKWAIKEAVILMLRESEQAKEFVAKLERKYNKGKALGLFAHKLGRTIYFMLKNKEVFQIQKFFSQ